MNDSILIKKYFPELSEHQQKQFDELPTLYKEWNEKINVISRKDIDNLMLHHVLHSLAIAKFISFKSQTEILDIGTGGGFPGIPLAIFFPECKFTLVDSIGKKIKVVEEVSKSIGLKNVIAIQSRAEDVKFQFDFIVSRATAPLNDLVRWSNEKVKPKNQNELKNGLICLKGGDIDEEIRLFAKKISILTLNSYFDEDFFETKKLVYLPL
ncbi:MAG: 16S rRNA (guanine(527)-N(7))-methyltransferase RsmG [Bacteroidia bacterium]